MVIAIIILLVIILGGGCLLWYFDKHEKDQFKPLEKPFKINGKEVDGIAFAYDRCHKIYILKNEAEMNEAKSYGADIYPLEKLPLIWEGACPLRFIEKWMSLGSFYYVKQFEDAVFEF